jgi:hypothetical protein
MLDNHRSDRKLILEGQGKSMEQSSKKLKLSHQTFKSSVDSSSSEIIFSWVLFVRNFADPPLLKSENSSFRDDLVSENPHALYNIY